VNWNDANLFCKWLTERERKLGLLAEGEYYRLPTDLEWSRAVGLSEESGASPQERDRQFPQQFPWGTEWPPVAGAGNFNGQETGSDIAIKNYSDPFPWTAPVGSGRANALGLHDLSGNVWEWVMDTYNKDSKARVLRGGAYDSSLKDALISSCRLPAQPERERDQWGFRVVRAEDGGLGAPKVP
jgi:formylglycine-generating enzyme required for sulfatase activity